MNRPDLERVMTAYLDAMNGHDPVALAGLYATDCAVESPLFASIHGRAAVEASYRQWFRIFPDIEFRPEASLIDPPVAAMLTHNSATHEGEFLGMPPTHKRIEFQTIRLVTFGEGEPLIVKERRIYDFTGLLVKIGVLRAKPARPG
jgi:predicted ester cyclase